MITTDAGLPNSPVRSEEEQAKIDKLAADVLRLARNTLLVHLRFLDVALDQLTPSPMEGLTFVTDGRTLSYGPSHVLRCYRDERESVAHAYLHLLLHGVFHHMFVHTFTDHDLWDLSCDIAVEHVIMELGLKEASVAHEAEQALECARLANAIGPLTAERIYRHFLNHRPSAQRLSQLTELFCVDDHYFWYDELRPKAPQANPPAPQSDDPGDAGDKDPGDAGDDASDGPGDAGDKDPGDAGDDASDPGDSDGGDRNDAPDAPGGNTPPSELEARWDEIAHRMQVDMETFTQKYGDRAGALTQNLREVNRERYDYSAFLRKFAVRGEALKINDDEFDYIFYTYGLKLYERVPLIEPLEYKEVKRIREFVIAIDTSGSVQGDTVQRFLQKTYNILESSESFFNKVNIHIIQCDAAVQDDALITCREDFEDYMAHMEIRGLGGTDFRPVFEHVGRLRAQGELGDLKGLIYFTDGWGGFPARKPDYDVAFVFVDDGVNNYDVPPWAIKLVLREEELV